MVDSADLEQPLITVGRLVAALWIAADPFTGSRRRSLHLLIAEDLFDVSLFSPGGPHTMFLQAAQRHQKEAEWWG
ncbi:MAG: hypothetical protein ACRDSL_11995 [Pseudonocardiaceae bacterium]